MYKSLGFGLIVLIMVPLVTAQTLNATLSPDDLWFIPGESKDFTIKVTNVNHTTFNATIYIKSLNTSVFLVNNSYLAKVQIVNWGVGESYNLPINITFLNNASLGVRERLKIKIYDDANTSAPIFEKYWYVKTVYPSDITYTLTAKMVNTSSVSITVNFPDERNSSSLTNNQTKDLFVSWAKIIDPSSNSVIAANSSNGLSLELNLTGRLGKYDIVYGVNTTDGRYSIEKDNTVYLLYSLCFVNVTAKWLGEINYYYPLDGPVIGGTKICIEGNVFYDKVFPLGRFGEKYVLNMEIKNGTNVLQNFSLTSTDGHFIKCFNAPTQNGNYTISLSASGLNNLSTNYQIKLEVNNIIEYVPTQVEKVLENIKISQKGNILVLRNENPFNITGELYVWEEDDEYIHFNLSSMNGTEVKLVASKNNEIPINISVLPNVPPGYYKLKFTLKTTLGDLNFTGTYQVKESFPSNKATYKRYFEQGVNKTRVTILVHNGYAYPVKGTITETIPKSIANSLSFLEPDNETKSAARLCSQQPDTLECIREFAITTKDCGICTTDTCWELCIQSYLESPGNKTYPIVFMQMPKVLEEDPVVSWKVNVPPGNDIRIVYIIVNKTVNPSTFPNLQASLKVEKPVQNQTAPQNISQPELVVYEKKPNNTWVWVIVLLVLVGIGGGAYYFMVLKKKEKKKVETVEEKPVGVEPPEEIEPKEVEKEEERGEKTKEKSEEKKEPSPEDAFKTIGKGFV